MIPNRTRAEDQVYVPTEAASLPADEQWALPAPRLRAVRGRTGGNTRLRVLLVDPFKMVCEGLRALLASVPDIEVVGEAFDGRSAINLVQVLLPDVVVLEVSMPELNGIETARRIQSLCPGVRVIALSTLGDERSVQRMMDAGASGYVLKNAAHDELLEAVRAASRGMTFMSPMIATLGAGRSPQVDVKPHVCVYSTLGPREREVLQLVAEGRTSGETGRTMHISIKTVETHRRNIARKLGIRGTAELTKYAIREGITTLESHG